MLLALLSATLIAAAPVHLLENATTTFAAQAPARLPDADSGKPTWYGWEPFLVDATAGVLFYGSVAFGQQQQPTAQSLMSVATIVLYGVGGPLLHWGRGRPTTALIDLGLRAGLPVGGLLLGLVLGVGTGQYGSWLLPCFVLGILAAIANDVVGLSWDAPEEGSPPEKAAPGWTLFVGEVRGASVAGLAGSF